MVDFLEIPEMDDFLGPGLIKKLFPRPIFQKFTYFCSILLIVFNIFYAFCSSCDKKLKMETLWLRKCLYGIILSPEIKEAYFNEKEFLLFL